MKRIIIVLLSIFIITSCEQKENASDPCSVVDSFLNDVKSTNREDYPSIVEKYFVENFWERDAVARELTFDAFDIIKKMNVSCERCEVTKEFDYEVVKLMSTEPRPTIRISRIDNEIKLYSCASYRKTRKSPRVWL